MGVGVVVGDVVIIGVGVSVGVEVGAGIVSFSNPSERPIPATTTKAIMQIIEKDSSIIFSSR